MKRYFHNFGPAIIFLIIYPIIAYGFSIIPAGGNVSDPSNTSITQVYSYETGTGQTWVAGSPVSAPTDTIHDQFYASVGGTPGWYSSFTRLVTGEMWQFDFQTPASGNKAIGITPYEMEDVLFYATNYDGTAVSATLSKCGLTSWVTCTAMSSAVTSSTIPAVASMVSTTLAAGEHFLVTLGTNTGTVTLLHTAITGTLLNVR